MRGLSLIAAAAPDRIVVHTTEVEDYEATVATSGPVQQLGARARLGGATLALNARLRQSLRATAS
jgi:hypothetical protein